MIKMDTVQLKIFKRLKKLRFYCFHSLFELDSCNMLKMALLYNANPPPQKKTKYQNLTTYKVKKKNQ